MNKSEIVFLDIVDRLLKYKVFSSNPNQYPKIGEWYNMMVTDEEKEILKGLTSEEIESNVHKCIGYTRKFKKD